MFFFTLGLVGTMFILKYGTILNPLKRMILPNVLTLKELFECSLCLGFWVGVFWMLVYKEYLHFITPFYSAAMCWFADSLLQFIQDLTFLINKYIDKKD